MIPDGQRSQDSKQEEGHPEHRSPRVFLGVQASKDEEIAGSSSSAESSGSYAFSGAIAREKLESGSTSDPENTQGIFSLPSAMISCEMSQYYEGSSSKQVEDPSLSRNKDALQIQMDAMNNDELDSILRFLLQKYQNKAQITMEELEHMVMHNSPEHLHLIFGEICECMHLSLGIIIREVGASGHTYELVSALGFTYSGVLDDTHSIIPKADLLILTLSLIFLMGNRINEEQLSEILTQREVLAERAHMAGGDPWKFISQDLVQAEYLVYQQVSNSDLTRYEFLWGPRAYDETTKKNILKLVLMVDGKDPRSYPHLYEQALREDNGASRASGGQDRSL